MSTIILLILLVFATAFSSPDTKPDNLADSSYTDLYENGYYEEAIRFLTDKTDADTVSYSPETENRRQILAFAYILTGEREKAVEVFSSILRNNPLYKLDPIRTSPKIYEVYSATRKAWQTEEDKHRLLQPSTTIDTSHSRSFYPAMMLDAAKILPFGTGQHINKKRNKGLLFGIIQAAALGGSIYAYNKRNDLFDPEYGWHSGNSEKNSYYITATRVQFGIFAAAYAWSVIDAYFDKE